MTSSEAPLRTPGWNLSSEHSGALLRMERLVRNRSGFTLLIAGYGDSAYRDRVAGYLVEGWLGGRMVDARDAQGEFHRLEDAIAAAAAQGAVQVIGLERWDSGVESLWQGFNYHRERLASLCRVPLLLWVPHGAVRLVAVEAPDLWAWRSGVFDLGNLPSAPAPETPHSVVDRGSADATEREARIKEITEYLERLQSVSHPADLALLVERGELFRDLGNSGAALSDFEAAVAGYQEADDRLGEAGALSHVADITALVGDPDSALRTLVDQVLPVYERLGDVRSRAVTWGRIADVYYSRGDLDEALRIRTEEELPVYERLGDVHSRAVTWGEIADVYYRRGDLDEALRIRTEEELPVYERLGDVRSKAVTWGRIANVYYSRGDLDEALRIRIEEQLPVYERLGDIDGIAAANWAIAQADLARDHLAAAVPRMLTAYQLLERTGRADGLAIIGETLGACLASTGESERGSEILRRSRECYEKLGRLSDAERVTLLIAGTEDSASSRSLGSASPD